MRKGGPPTSKLESLSRATMADVAKRAGVSMSTVSRVINASVPVAEETAARVRSVIAELNFVPHAAARGLATKHASTLGLVVPDIASPFLIPLLRGIITEARAAGFSVLVHSTMNEPPPSPGFHRPLGEHNTDGLLVFAGSMAPAELHYLHGLGFPIVLLYQSPPNALDIPY